MKQIVVLDNSGAVRETLALLLERDFVVEKRPVPSSLTLADIAAQTDLVIVGAPAGLRAHQEQLVNFASSAPCPVLLLVPSHALAAGLGSSRTFGCLGIPFDPFRLRAEVERLTAAEPSPTRQTPVATETALPSRFINYPYVSRVTATLIQRFATAALPVLIMGEIGSGQEPIVRAMAALAARPTFYWSAGDIDATYLRAQEKQLAEQALGDTQAVTLVIWGVDKLAPATQELVAQFLAQRETQLPRCCLLATSNQELLPQVYSGQYHAELYYRLATLDLRLAPLRERREDIALIAQQLADTYAAGLDIQGVGFSHAARERLENYLWFGNLDELTTVIARTLAIHRQPTIEEADLVFDIGGEIKLGTKAAANPPSPRTAAPPAAPSVVAAPRTDATGEPATPPVHEPPAPPDIRVFIHELAHEIKNPMVTIKTFAQLLADRYQDEGFRARYKEVVDEDIGRIDQLLEVMVEFADFSTPRPSALTLADQARVLVANMSREFNKRQIEVDWAANPEQKNVHVDETHVRYILKNIFLAALNQTKAGTRMTIDLDRPGHLKIIYTGEATRVAAVPAHLGAALAADLNGGSLPLRILLAKQLAERNHGHLKIDRLEREQDAIELEFPVA